MASSSLDHTLTVAQYTAGARSSSSGAGGPAAAAAAATANTGAAGGGGGGGGATWDAHRPHQHWRAHDAPILRVAWAHPEFGSVLASCAVDGLVKVWAEEQTPRSGATTGTTATAQGQQAGSQGQSHGSTGAGVTTQQQQQHTSRWVCKATLTDPRGTARAVEFAPPSFGLKLACISSDSHLRVWACVDPLALADWSLIEDVPLASLSPQPFGFPPSLGGGAGGGAGAQGQQGQGQQGGANPSATGSGGSSVTQLPPTQSGMSTPGLSGVPGESPMGSLTSPASALQGRNFDFNNPGSLSSGGGSGSRPFLPSSGNTGSFAGSDANLAQQQQQAQMPLAHAGAIESDGGWALSWCSESWWGERIAVSAGTSGVIRVRSLLPHCVLSTTHNADASNTHSCSICARTSLTSTFSRSPHRRPLQRSSRARRQSHRWHGHQPRGETTSFWPPARATAGRGCGKSGRARRRPHNLPRLSTSRVATAAAAHG